MNVYKEISASELGKTPFEMIGKDWMLISAVHNGRVNMMTASWGGMGVMWNKDVVFAVIRPQRFTKHFIDAEDKFTISFYGEEYRKTLGYCGSASGNNEDKVAGSGLTPVFSDGTVSFAEAEITVVCKKLFATEMSPDSFIDKEIIGKIYSEGDFHTVYIAEIEKVYVKNS